MLGKIISAVAGRAIGNRIGGARAGSLGTVAGAALPFVLKRMGPMGMLGALIGGYAIKKYAESLDTRDTVRQPR
ncbi:hypothetical protein [Glacieibacterium sp.]|uniref:hypothetical protein n=1 Tax=Glacieibacterium sp. TaxID=2860237 RepID=UPI003B000C52